MSGGTPHVLQFRRTAPPSLHADLLRHISQLAIDVYFDYFDRVRPAEIAMEASYSPLTAVQNLPGSYSTSLGSLFSFY